MRPAPAARAAAAAAPGCTLVQVPGLEPFRGSLEEIYANFNKYKRTVPVRCGPEGDGGPISRWWAACWSLAKPCKVVRRVGRDRSRLIALPACPPACPPALLCSRCPLTHPLTHSPLQGRHPADPRLHQVPAGAGVQEGRGVGLPSRQAVQGRNRRAVRRARGADLQVDAVYCLDACRMLRRLDAVCSSGAGEGGAGLGFRTCGKCPALLLCLYNWPRGPRASARARCLACSTMSEVGWLSSH